MKDRRYKKAILAGIISGCFLGFFLKVIETITSLKVYTLLLNVDYIPWINRFRLSESIEFGFHLIVSILLSLFLVKFLTTKEWESKRKITLVVVVCITIALLLFPITALSTRTPALNNYSALFYWLLGHALYGLLLGYLLNNRLVKTWNHHIK
ncbi:hypothetical protein ACFSO7_15060 [Bacillus sp. CGMCC 1.16607]|uniref:hypothetical protein n=1 Tax=Bacillus sp. CGMCC 1.16607 TaxID=3351842 RepID=UPI00363EB178